LTYEENPPSVGVDYAHWYGYVAEKARTLTRPDMSNGELLLNFVKYTCEAVQEDLTDFFIKYRLSDSRLTRILRIIGWIG
jgi:hypothetical protein